MRPCRYRITHPACKPQEAEPKNFAIGLDIKGFKPEEVKLEVDKETRTINIQAKHEEKNEENGSFVKRSMERSYTVPEHCNIDEVSTNFREDGRMFIKAPAMAQALTQEKQDFTYEIDVAGYAPNTLDLEVDANTRVATITASKKDQEDNQNLSQTFKIPEEYDLDQMSCKVNKEGKLQVTVARLPEKNHEKTKKNIPIDMDVE